MYVRYIAIPISLLFFCACFSSCHRGISTSASRPTEELPQLSDASDIPAYFFNKPVIAVFQTRCAPYPDDMFRPEITFAVWDNGTFLLNENRNYVTGALSGQSLSYVNNTMKNKKYCSYLTKWLPQYPHSDCYYSILSIGSKDYSAKSSFRLTGANDLNDMSGFQKSNKSRIVYIRKTNDTIKEHLKNRTASAISLSEADVMQIISQWGYGPPYLTNEEIKEITQRGYGLDDNSSNTD
ncbi:hypothetical protein [Gimesia aquarii]|uniref:Lipoprotein n=1 Tax=Gimesia aquarii TaxID=2527964 RepID=A0A517VQS4_9PLAN|nr:hypothetical protein [Gimesia aquarii]QDT95374.1 hypothetical protein V144x_08160 [Gimesia aquarii]